MIAPGLPQRLAAQTSSPLLKKINAAFAVFVEIGGEIGMYLRRDQALAGVKDYDRAEKEPLFEAELKVCLESARTGKALGECGLPSLVRFGDRDPYSYTEKFRFSRSHSPS